jgi:hypothetical protein
VKVLGHDARYIPLRTVLAVTAGVLKADIQ